MSDLAGGQCWYCHTALGPLDYGRADTCKNCGRDTKTCKGCVHFDATANNQCHENQAERVVDKERSNFCDYFKPSSQNRAKDLAGPSSKDAVRAAAEALFKKK